MKNDNEIDDQEKQAEGDRDDTSDDEELIEDFIEDESGIDVYSKNSEVWTVEEQVTYRDDPPSCQSPPISPTSALTIPSATFSNDDEDKYSPATPSVTPETSPSTLPTASGKQGQQGGKEQGFLEMLCGDPLQVANSFSLYGEGVQNNLHTLALHQEQEKLTVVKEKETEQTA